MSFTQAIGSIVAVVLVHIALMFSGIYVAVPWIDAPMHFLGGLVMGMLALAIHHHLIEHKHVQNPPWWFVFLFTLSFVMLIGAAWEGYEWIFDHTLGVRFGLAPSQPSVTDTMGDFLMDAIGALIATLLFRRKF